MSENSTEITCPKCQTVFALPLEKISPKGKLLRCSVCQHKFLVRLSATPLKEIEDRDFSSVPDDPFSVSPDQGASASEESSIEVDLQESSESEDVFATVDDGEELVVDGDEDFSFDEPVFGDDAESGEEVMQEDNDQEDSAAAEGMVEFFVENEEGEINRIETVAAKEKQDESVEPDESIEQTGRREVPSDIEMPDDSMKHPVGFEEAETESRAQITPAPKPKRWKDPSKASGKKKLLTSEQDARPSSGIVYHSVLIVIGALGLLTNFIELAGWSFDPVWGGTLILLGIGGFFLQNLSGLFIAGFFNLAYTFALFSRQKEVLENNVLDGVIHLGIIFAVGVLFIIIYYVLMSRKRGLFRLLEGKGQSIAALLLGFIGIAVVYWSNMYSPQIYALHELPIGNVTVDSFSWYSGVPLSVIVQSCIGALAVAIGLSAMKVRNRLLLLANFGLILGILALLFQFAPLVIGPITFYFSV